MGSLVLLMSDLIAGRFLVSRSRHSFAIPQVANRRLNRVNNNNIFIQDAALMTCCSASGLVKTSRLGEVMGVMHSGWLSKRHRETPTPM